MKLKSFSFVCSAIFLVVSACTLIINKPRRQTLSSRETAACIRDSACKQRFFSAHRGNGFGVFVPPNSREAVRRAAGVAPIIEIDIRLSRDGEMFLLHDKDIHGIVVGEKTSQELRGVFLSNGEPLPSFAEIYETSRGRSLLDLDFKDDAIEKLADWISMHGSFDDVIFFVVGDEAMRTATRLKTKYPSMIIMVRVHNIQSDVRHLKEIFPVFPEIIHTDIPHKEDVEFLHALHTKVYVKALRLYYRIPILKEFLAERLNWLDVDIIQTDEPLFWQNKLPR